MLKPRSPNELLGVVRELNELEADRVRDRAQTLESPDMGITRALAFRFVDSIGSLPRPGGGEFGRAGDGVRVDQRCGSVPSIDHMAERHRLATDTSQLRLGHHAPLAARPAGAVHQRVWPSGHVFHRMDRQWRHAGRSGGPNGGREPWALPRVRRRRTVRECS
jgi:hypothetical protein